MEHTPNLLKEDLLVDTEAYQHLMESAKWAKFLGIVGFALCGLIGLFAIFARSFISRIAQSPGALPAPEGMATTLSVMYLVIAVIYFLLSFFIYRFGIKMKQGLLATDQQSFSQGLYNLRMFYRVSGIITIIYLAMLAIVLIVLVAAAVFSS